MRRRGETPGVAPSCASAFRMCQHGEVVGADARDVIRITRPAAHRSATSLRSASPVCRRMWSLIILKRSILMMVSADLS